MNRRPATVLVAGLLCLASAVYGPLKGTLGLEFFEFTAARPLVIVAALVHLYAAFGLLTGDNLARGVTLWLLGAAFFTAWAAMWHAAHSHHGVFADYAGGAIKLLIVGFFLWHLSGPGAVAYTHGGRHGEDHGHGDDHGGHGHGGHGRAHT